MSKVLFITNISRGVGSFSIASINVAKKLGLDYYMAGNFESSAPDKIENDEKTYGIKIKHIDLKRSPYSIKNMKALKQLEEFVEEENIDFIHCNTPTGGILGRLVGKKHKIKKVIYQAHGFHFYKGAPLINWMLFYPIERILARFTDAIITINREDFVRAQRFHVRNKGKVYYVPGVGINLNEYDQQGFDRAEKRKELGVSPDDVMVVSAGDLIKRKNYATSIKAIAKTGNAKIHYMICGQGPLKEELEKYANELGVGEQIHFLGFRSDVKEILFAADVFLFTTFQEGLPRSLSEAMACGLPCLASKIRGNVDLLSEDSFKCLFDPTDSDGFSEALDLLAKNQELRIKLGLENKKRIEDFSFEAVTNQLQKIYGEEFV